MQIQFLAVVSRKPRRSNHRPHIVDKQYTMETAATPVKPAAKAGCIPCRVTPETKDTQSYNEIVQLIMDKDSKRSFCLACKDSNESEKKDKSPEVTQEIKCSFYKHESVLIDAAEYEMKNPKKAYKDNKEQGARLACYKLWTMLEVGRLGRSRRKPLPVCVEARIKLIKPSATYKGYKGYKEKEKEEDAAGDSTSSDDKTWAGTIFNSPLGSYKKPRIS